MSEWVGFWSYVHADDEAEFQRVVQLGQDIATAMSAKTGEEVELFVDQDAIHWGARWRAVRDGGLSNVAFFIPVLTPRYFMSAECRRELQLFARGASDLGVKELVLPLHYLNVPELAESEPADDLVGLVKEFQWVDWRQLRLSDRPSSEYRTAVDALADRLVAANREAERSTAVTEARAEHLTVVRVDGRENDSNGELETEQPGTLDLVADAELEFPRWAETIIEIGQVIETIGNLFTEATAASEDADRRNAGMAGRIRVARSLAQGLNPHVDRCLELVNRFATQLHTVDRGMQVLIENVGQEAVADPVSVATACELFRIVREFQTAVATSTGAALQMADSVAPLEGMSRDLRPPLRRLRHGLTLLREARSVVDQWVSLIDASGVECAF